MLGAHARFPQAQIIQPGVEVIDETGAVGSAGLVDRVKGLLSPRGRGTRLLAGEALAISLMRGNWLYFPSIAWQSEALVRTNSGRVSTWSRTWPSPSTSSRPAARS